MSDSTPESNVLPGQLSPETATKDDASVKATSVLRLRVSLTDIQTDPEQARKEFPEAGISALADSIEKNGLITPILVIPSADSEGKYEIVDGERRYRALCKLAREYPDNEAVQSIPVTVTTGDKRINGLLANMARLRYNPMEFAEALNRIKVHEGMDTGQLGDLIGKSRSLVSEYLSLLNLPDEIRNAAKIESCVPFRVLKKLAAKDIRDEDKIIEYNKLHKAYQTKRQNDDKIENRTHPKSAWTADRKAKSFQKKVDALAEKLAEFNVSEMKDTKQKAELKESLEVIRDKANDLISLLN